MLIAFWIPAPTHLILLMVVLGGVLGLALPPQLLQVGLRALQGVLLQFVLRLVALEGGLSASTDNFQRFMV